MQIDRGTLPRNAQVVVGLREGGAAEAGPQRVNIPARSSVKTVVSLDLPGKRTPGDAFRFSVTQRLAHRIIGGSTYEIRVPPAVLRIGGERAE